MTEHEPSAIGRAARRSDEPGPLPVRVLAVAYTALCTGIVWYVGHQWSTATQVTVATLVLTVGSCLVAALVVRRTTSLRTIALRTERRHGEATEQLASTLERQLDTTQSALAELGAVRERLDTLDTRGARSDDEQAKLRDDVAVGFDRIVKSLGILGRQMRQLDTRLTMAEAEIKARQAGSAERARELDETLSLLAQAQTQLSLRSEAVFTEVRRQKSPDREEQGWNSK